MSNLLPTQQSAWFVAFGLASVLAAACSGEAAPKEKAVAVLPDSGNADTGPSTEPFRLTSIAGCGAAGYQTVAASRGTKVAFATIASTPRTVSCTTMNGPKDVAVYDICYAESSGGAGFSTLTVTSQPYPALLGVGLALNAAGEASMVFTGGDSAELRAGASDLLLASGTSLGFGAPRTIATGSASGSLVPDQAANCVQDVCNSGDATGYWPAIAFDGSGKAGVAYRDIHFGFANDDFASSDVEFARSDAYTSTTIDVARGGGTYLRLGFGADGKAIVVHYSAERDPGIWINRETAQGWVAKKLTNGAIGEQLGFGIGPTGTIAIAYYDSARGLLQYIESSDGSSWTEPSSPDRDGATGMYPSLAFDAAGDPAIAYYRCSEGAGANANCVAVEDGLFLARRKAGAWSVRDVATGTSGFEGLYPALAFVNGKAVIGYQARSYDPIAKSNTVAFWVAEEP